MVARLRSWMLRHRPRPVAAATALALVGFVALRAAAHAAGLGQDVIDPPFTESGARLFDILAQLYLVLGPLFTERVTEWLRTNYPAWEAMDGKVASMNVALVLFAIGAAVGLAVKPDLVIPDSPTSGALLDWASWAQAVLLVAVGAVGWFVAGGRGLHDWWKRRTGGGLA